MTNKTVNERIKAAVESVSEADDTRRQTLRTETVDLITERVMKVLDHMMRENVSQAYLPACVCIRNALGYRMQTNPFCPEHGLPLFGPDTETGARGAKGAQGPAGPALPLDNTSTAVPQKYGRVMKVLDHMMRENGPPTALLCVCIRNALGYRMQTNPFCPEHGLPLFGPDTETGARGAKGAQGPAGPALPLDNTSTAVPQKYGRVMHTVSGRTVLMCQADGCLVIDRQQHDIWHSKTRSVV